MTERELTRGDPRRTIHFLVGRAAARRYGNDTPLRPNPEFDSLLAWSAYHDDPEERVG